MVQGGYNAVLDPADSVELHFARHPRGRQVPQRPGAGLDAGQRRAAGDPRARDPRRLLLRPRTRTAGSTRSRSPASRSTAPSTAATSPGSRSWARLRDQMFRHRRPRAGGRAARSTSCFDADGELGRRDRARRHDAARSPCVRARVVVIATGGAATMYRIAAPAREKTGDGVAMCWRAGLRAARHGDDAVPPHRAAGRRVADDRRGARGGAARRRRAPAATRAASATWSATTRSGMERSTRDVVSRAGYTGDHGRPRHPGRRRADRHLAPRRGGGRAAVRRAWSPRTRQIGDDLATGPVEVSPDGALPHGRRRSSTATAAPSSTACSWRARTPAASTAPTASAATASPSRPSSAPAPATPPPPSRRERALRDPDPAQVARVGRARRSPRCGATATRFRSSSPASSRTRCGRAAASSATAPGSSRPRERLADLGERLAAVAVPGGTAANPAWQETLDLAQPAHGGARDRGAPRSRARSPAARTTAPTSRAGRRPLAARGGARGGADGAIELGWRPVDFDAGAPRGGGGRRVTAAQAALRRSRSPRSCSVVVAFGVVVLRCAVRAGGGPYPSRRARWAGCCALPEERGETNRWAFYAAPDHRRGDLRLPGACTCSTSALALSPARSSTSSTSSTAPRRCGCSSAACCSRSSSTRSTACGWWRRPADLGARAAGPLLAGVVALPRCSARPGRP